MEIDLKERKRIAWIDMLRGFSIILIVIGHIIVHCDKLGYAYKYLNSFFVPIFFVISGLVFYVRDNEKYKSFFVRTFKRVMIPYFIFAILFLIPYSILGNDVQVSLNKSYDVNLGKSLLAVLYGNGHQALLKQNSALWFLPCLFIVQQLYFMINKILKNKQENKVYICSILLFFLLGLMNYKIPHVRLPWAIDIAIVLFPFFLIGKFLMLTILKWKNMKYNVVIAIGSIIIGFIIHIWNAEVSCKDHLYGNYFLFFLSAIFTCIGIVILFSKMREEKILSIIGRNTMGILIFHKLIVVVFQTKLGKITDMLTGGTIIQEIFMTLVCLLITTLICVIINKVIRKLFPILIGETKEKISEKYKKQQIC